MSLFQAFLSRNQFQNTWRHQLACVLTFMLILWPLFHLVLSVNQLLSPWKFLGFGMYSTPSSRVELSFYDCEMPERLLSEPSISGYQQAKQRFLLRYRAAPSIYSPVALAKEVLRENPECSCAESRIAIHSIEASSSRWHTRVVSRKVGREEL